MARKAPIRRQVYTFQEICADLYLRDTPHLTFWHNGVLQVIQTSHCLDEDMLAIPGMAESRWEYVMETSEWIPIFRAENDSDVLVLVDMEPYIDPYAEKDGVMNVIPKGTDREPQYYALNADGMIVSQDGQIHQPPKFDSAGYRIR